jgi:pentatricopeptide repeat protein
MLIHGLCIDFRVKDAEALLNGFIRRNLLPNAICYSNLIHQYCEMGLIEDVFRVKRLVESNGCKPDVVLYTMLIDTLMKNGNLQGVNKL